MTSKTLSLSLLLLLLLPLTGCSNHGAIIGSFDVNAYKTTVQSAKHVLPIAVEMEKLFGDADHFITHYGFDKQPKLWNTEVFFGGRYELTMQVNVEIDYAAHRIIRMVDEPKFYLVECEKIDILPSGIATETYNTSYYRQFGPNEWNEIYKSAGDFSAVNLKLDPTSVPNFDESVAQARRPRIPVSLIH